MLNELKRVFASFERHGVKYLVMGGVAANLYGVPRSTYDLDILIESTEENIRQMLDALLEVGMTTASMIEPEALAKNEITMFKDFVQLDVQTFTPGISFEEAWDNKVQMCYEGQAFYVLSLNDLKKSKRAAGRNVDLEDVRLLELKKQEEQ